MRRKLLLILTICLLICSALFVFSACAPKKEESRLSFAKIHGKEEYAVVGFGEEDSGHVIIPSTYKGLPVTSINKLGHMSYNGIQIANDVISVKIPKSIMEIKAGAFMYSDCTIYCEIKESEKPDGWASGWNYFCPIVWDCENNDVANDGYVHIEVDGVRYSIKDGFATVMQQSKAIKTANIVSEIKYNNKIYPVTTIRGAFYNCSSLTSVIIPKSITEISFDAFSYCPSTTIYCEFLESEKPDAWADGWNHFYPIVWDYKNNDIASDGKIYTIVDGIRYAIKDGMATVARQSASCTTAVIPNKINYKNQEYLVTSIVDRAFQECYFVDCAIIPKSVMNIGDDVFFRCNLTIYCEMKEGEKPVGWIDGWNSSCPIKWDYKNNDIATDGNVYTVLDGVRYAIKNGIATVTRQRYGIKVANIARNINYKGQKYSVNSIEDFAFTDCVSLFKVTIPKDICSIGAMAFYDCGILMSLVVPSSVTSIGNQAFIRCDNLTIYCEIKESEKPEEWTAIWNANCPVIWEYSGQEIQ